MKRFFALIFSPEAATRLAFISFLFVSPEYFWCRTHHFCGFGGHSAEDVDTVLLPILCDAIWGIGFVAAAVFGFRSQITFRYVFLFFLALVFLAIASDGLFFLPIWIVTCLFSIACLRGWIE